MRAVLSIGNVSPMDKRNKLGRMADCFCCIGQERFGWDKVTVFLENEYVGIAIFPVLLEMIFFALGSNPLDLTAGTTMGGVASLGLTSGTF